jgi:hypothetical protein
VAPDGRSTSIQLSLSEALDLYTVATESLPQHLRFTTEPRQPVAWLTPSAKLAHLVTKSRELAAVGVGDEEA